MVRRIVSLLIVLVSLTPCVYGQQYPPEWIRYTYDNYLYAIEKDVNAKKIPETTFKEGLLKAAQANLARQIEVRVSDNAEISKVSEDGHSSVTYVSNTQYSTDVTLNMVETRTYYDVSTRQGYAIAFIDKGAASRYWLNEYNVLTGKTQNAVAVAQAYVETGFKDRAKSELADALSMFPEIDESLSWLAVFDISASEMAELLSRRNFLNRSVKQMLSDLEYGVSVYVDCSADVFGNPYPSLTGSVKSILAEDGCNFSDDFGSSDWVVKIVGTSREHNAMAAGSQTLYFVYVDVSIQITKNNTGQLIYEGVLSKKGSHGTGYVEAARAAYRKLTSDVCEIIASNINNQ